MARYTPSNKLVMAALDEYVTGHIDAKKALIVLLSRSQLRAHQKYSKYMDDENLVSPMKLLLVGASGTGKTHLVDSLQRVALFPLVKIDATQMNPTGASGGIKVKELKTKIYETAVAACSAYPDSYPFLEIAIEQTVVYIDEIDKLGQSFESSGNWNRHVQSNFLTMFDNKDEYAGVSYIFSGAFDSITRKIETKPLGFTVSKSEIKKELLDEQILKSGLIPEIVGRLNAIVELDIFTEKDLFHILKSRIIPKKNRDLAAYGSFVPRIKKTELARIVQECLRSGQGVRYLQRAIDKLFMDFEFNCNVDDVLSLPEGLL